MTWRERLEQAIRFRAARLMPHLGDREAWVRAAVEAVERALAGLGPDDSPGRARRGVRAAINMAAIHVPAFCDASTGGHNAYKNAYDLGQARRLGDLPSDAQVPARTRVDDAIRQVTGIQPEEIYFAAVELNGTGIRFYGDLCFVLKGDLTDSATPVLESNSYDALRPPRTPRGATPTPDELHDTISSMRGDWGPDLADIVGLKVLALRGDPERRLTTGQISQSVLEDEDYVEILRRGSFDVDAVEEARSAAADVALETRIGEAARLAPVPSAAELEWRNQRRAAGKALAAQGRHVRTMTTSGRVKG